MKKKNMIKLTEKEIIANIENIMSKRPLFIQWLNEDFFNVIELQDLYFQCVNYGHKANVHPELFDDLLDFMGRKVDEDLDESGTHPGSNKEDFMDYLAWEYKEGKIGHYTYWEVV